MKQVLLVGLVLLVVLVPVIASAINATVNGTSVTLDYTEPQINADRSALKDLDHTTPKYDIGAGYVNAPAVPASAVTGGGYIVTDITVPVLPGMEVDVKFKATATDRSNNESKDSAVIIKRIDKLEPGEPQ